MQLQRELADIEAWARSERGPADGTARRRARRLLLDTLVDQIERDRRQAQPDALSPGSPERLVAHARQRRIRTLATTLGYQPPAREIAVEIASHAVVEAAPVPEMAKPLLEAAGESGGDGAAAPEISAGDGDARRKGQGATRTDRSKRRRGHGRRTDLDLDPGRGLGLEPW